MKNWFSNMRVGLKLSLGFGLCLALSAVIAITAWSGLQELKRDMDLITKDALPGITQIGKFDAAARQYRVLQYRYGIYKVEDKFQEVVALQNKQEAQADQALKDYESTLFHADDRKNFEQLKETWKAFVEKWNSIKTEVHSLPVEQGVALLEKETTSLFLKELMPHLTEVVKLKEANGEAAKRDAAASLKAAVSELAIAFALALVCGIVFARMITVAITKPIMAISSGIESLTNHCIADLKSGMVAFANSDLTQGAQAVTPQVDLDSKDELGTIAKAFNRAQSLMVDTIAAYNEARASLSSLVQQVRESAQSVAESSDSMAAASEESTAAASEIASGSEKLARNASEVAEVMVKLTNEAGALSRTSDEQQRLVTQVNHSLEDAATEIGNVSHAAEQMSEIAITGNSAVEQTVQAMERVRERFQYSAQKVNELDAAGQKIGEIVATIDAIAEQTNLLALNAAIEAARAGEQGRGFAVVAEEVRKLAEQSGTSTKEIADLIAGVRRTVDETVKAINGTTTEVETGSEKSQDAGRALEEIVRAATQVLKQSQVVAQMTLDVRDCIATVATASAQNQEMVSGMTEDTSTVSDSIQNVAAISQQSAAGAEELSASIHEVSNAASQLAHTSAELETLVSAFQVDLSPSQNQSFLKVA